MLSIPRWSAQWVCRCRTGSVHGVICLSPVAATLQAWSSTRTVPVASKKLLSSLVLHQHNLLPCSQGFPTASPRIKGDGGNWDVEMSTDSKARKNKLCWNTTTHFSKTYFGSIYTVWLFPLDALIYPSTCSAAPSFCFPSMRYWYHFQKSTGEVPSKRNPTYSKRSWLHCRRIAAAPSPVCQCDFGGKTQECEVYRWQTPL